jgi:hypothetical protein
MPAPTVYCDDNLLFLFHNSPYATTDPLARLNQSHKVDVIRQSRARSAVVMTRSDSARHFEQTWLVLEPDARAGPYRQTRALTVTAPAIPLPNTRPGTRLSRLVRPREAPTLASS